MANAKDKARRDELEANKADGTITAEEQAELDKLVEAQEAEDAV